jgi:hypothetical protein
MKGFFENLGYAASADGLRLAVTLNMLHGLSRTTRGLGSR